MLALLLGAGLGFVSGLTGIGGGMVRDVLVREVPTVLRTELYAVAALAGAAVVVIGAMLHLATFWTASAGAIVCTSTGLRISAGAKPPSGRRMSPSGAGIGLDLPPPHATKSTAAQATPSLDTFQVIGTSSSRPREQAQLDPRAPRLGNGFCLEP